MFARSDTVVLRRLRESDLERFQAYRNDPDVARYQDWAQQSDAEARRFLCAMERLDPVFRPGAWGQIAVADPDSDVLIGDMGLFLNDAGDECELGITLARASQRQGRGTAAMHLAIGLCWTLTQAQTIRAWADQRNGASVAMLRKVGMTHLGTETGEVVEEAFALTRPR